MMVLKNRWDLKSAAFISLTLLTILLLIIVFAGKKSYDSNYEDRIAQKDSIISMLNVNISIAQKDKLFHQKEAEKALDKIGQNKTYYIQSKKEYEKIPTNVRSLSRDSLRREVADFE